MTELGQEVMTTTKNLLRSFVEPSSPDGYREVIDGKLGPMLIIRGFGKKSSRPEANLKEEMHRANMGGVIAGITAGPGNEGLDSFIPQLVDEVSKFDGKIILVGYIWED